MSKQCKAINLLKKNWENIFSIKRTFCKIGSISASKLRLLFEYFPQWQKNIEKIFARQKNLMMSDLSYFESEHKESSLFCEDHEEKGEKVLTDNLMEVLLIYLLSLCLFLALQRKLFFSRKCSIFKANQPTRWCPKPQPRLWRELSWPQSQHK